MSKSIYTPCYLTKTHNFVYLIVNTENRMKYIGVHSSQDKPFADGYNTSSDYLKPLLESHPDHFNRTILGNYKTRQEAEEWEIRIQKLVNADINPEYYNKHIQGNGWVSTAESVRKAQLTNNNKSAEEKQKRLDKISATKAERSPKEKLLTSIKIKNNFYNRSPEEHQKRQDKISATKNARSPEEKKIAVSNQKAGHAKRTPEQKAATTKRRLKALDDRTESEKQNTRDKRVAAHKNRKPTEEAARVGKIKKALSEKTPEQKAATLSKWRATRAIRGTDIPKAHATR